MKKIIIGLVLVGLAVSAIFFGYKSMKPNLEEDPVQLVLNRTKAISNFGKPLGPQDIPVENLKPNAAIDADGHFYFTRDIMIGYSHEFVKELWSAKLDVLKFAENTSRRNVPYGIILKETPPRPLYLRGVIPVGIQYPNTYVIESVTENYQPMYAIVTFSRGK